MWMLVLSPLDVTYLFHKELNNKLDTTSSVIIIAEAITCDNITSFVKLTRFVLMILID